MKPRFFHALLVAAISTTAVAGNSKMTTTIAPGIATPDTLETSIGTLHLSDGVPKPDTIEKIYDNLDRSRVLQAYMLAIPIVNQPSMRDSLRKFGPDNQTGVIWENLVDPKTVELPANDNTIYNFIWIDTHNGPVVLEVPPMSLGVPSNFVFPGDYAFWELLNQVIQEEPSEGSDPTTLGLFASIGIEKGKPFNPDERMKKI